MLYYLWAFAGQRAARYWGYLISGSGASFGSLDSMQRSNSTSTKTTSSPALAVDSSGSPTSMQLSSSPLCRAVDSIAAEAVIMSDFEATAQEFKAFTLPTITKLTDEHAAAAPAHALAGFKGDAIVLVVKDRYGAPQSVVVPDEGLFTLKVDVYLPDTFDVLEFFPPLHAMQRVACERLLGDHGPRLRT